MGTEVGYGSIIRFAEHDPGRRGDIFTNLIRDLFFALGYERARMNISKSGRELDLIAHHRLEARQVVVECKATDSPVGGADINKFVGVLDAEKRRAPRLPTVGYFVSLSGYTETARQQELDLPTPRLILMDQGNVLSELVHGRVLVPLERATEVAGRMIEKGEANLELDESHELLAHHLGWIWAIYYNSGGARKACALIHADGRPLEAALATQVVESDEVAGGPLGGFHVISAPSTGRQRRSELERARLRYLQYIEAEFGTMTLEGLPADQEIGSRRLKLDAIFVPLRLEPAHSQRDHLVPGTSTQATLHIGEILSKHARIAVLAPPGGGKTSLVKRLALTYSQLACGSDASDDPPTTPLLPLVIRCRYLEVDRRLTVVDALRETARRGDLGNDTDAFIELALRDAQAGSVLLLVDGLDEITDDGMRVFFVTQLRTFLSVYPHIRAVVTSREPGFRPIGPALAAVCEPYRILELSDADIRQLTILWHREVVGPGTEVAVEAAELARLICRTDRVRQLAQNPLLLTTLLLVKRWVGELPRRRSALYGKAIEVLLMTWNAEAHEPIDQDEAIPQLAFVAFAMMEKGVQTVSSRLLGELLERARVQMPEVLSYARTSVAEFVRRIENRSSLLVQSGYVVEDGTLQPIYEFKHLTFQEYLAALAIVGGYFSCDGPNLDMRAVVRAHLLDPKWREVFPLAIVLAGRNGRLIIDELLEEIALVATFSNEPDRTENESLLLEVLIQCIADEPQLAPEVLERAIEAMIRHGVAGRRGPIGESLASRYSAVIVEVATRLCFSAGTDLATISSFSLEILLSEPAIALREIASGIERQFQEHVMPQVPELLRQLEGLLRHKDAYSRVQGAMGVVELAEIMSTCDQGVPTAKATALAQERDDVLNGCADSCRRIAMNLTASISSISAAVRFGGCKGLGSLAELRRVDSELTASALPRVLETWWFEKNPEVQLAAAWTLVRMPIVARESVRVPSLSIVDVSRYILDSVVVENWELHPVEPRAAVLAAYYLNCAWSERDLIPVARRVLGSASAKRMSELLRR